MVNEYYFIERENMPCIYELSWAEKTPAILLKIHKDFVKNCHISAEAPWVCHFMSEFKFSAFDCFRKNLLGELFFGFDGAFYKIGEREDFVIFEIRIPKVEKQLNETCRECNGIKQDKNIEGQRCLYCKGTGMELEMDWKPVYAISASLTIFFGAVSLKFCKADKTSCKFSQLVIIETITERKMHGGSLGGVYSFPLVKFLSSFAPDIENMTSMEDNARSLLVRSAEQMSLSGRAFHRIIKVAQTVADLSKKPVIQETDVLEALQYRKQM